MIQVTNTPVFLPFVDFADETRLFSLKFQLTYNLSFHRIYLFNGISDCYFCLFLRKISFVPVISIFQSSVLSFGLHFRFSCVSETDGHFRFRFRFLMHSRFRGVFSFPISISAILTAVLRRSESL
jgi:hypothetical protein